MAFYNKLSLFGCLIFCAVGAFATQFTDCGSTADLTAVRVPGCDVPPCDVRRGTNVTISYDFIARAPAETLQLDVKGVVGGIALPWPGTFPPPCTTFTAGDCPLTTGESATQQSTLEIDPSWPTLTANARWKLLDQNNDALVCFQIAVHLI